MKQRYTELLPSYLEGANIQGHAGIIDGSTDVVYNLLGLLSSWSGLTRPLLIEKVQEKRFEAEYKIHVDIPYAIRSITVSGDYTALLEFSEDDLVTSQVLSFLITDEDVAEHEDARLCSVYGVVNAELLVVVETFEGYTYRKAYPENDTLLGDDYDHDQLLDKLGSVLTVPRRVYSPYRLTDALNTPTTPYLFAKQVENIKGHNTILSCTEDDYYYAQRLIEFINNWMVEGMSLEKSKLLAVYNATVTEEINYNELVCHMDIDDFDEKNMAHDDTSEANTYVYKVGVPEYINLPVPDLEDLSEFLRAYVPLTKNVIVMEDTGSYVELVEELLPVYYTGETVSIPLRVTDINGKPLEGMRVTARLGHTRNRATGYTNEEGIFTFHKTLDETGTGDNFTVTVQEMLPYEGTTETFTTSVQEPTSIPITCDVEVLSATTEGISFGVELQDTGGDPFTCDATIMLLYNQNILGEWSITDDSSITINTPSDMTWPKGSTYTFRIPNTITSTAPRGYKYTTTEVTILVTIPSDMTSIDCTTISAWIRNNERVTTSAVLDADGYITSVRGGSTDYFTVCQDLILQKNMIIEIDFLMKTGGTYGYGLQQVITDSPNKLFCFGTTMEEKHSGGTQTTQTVASMPTNTLTTIKYEIDADGYITLTDSNGTTHKSNSAFSDTELALMQLVWKHWGSDSVFSIHRLAYNVDGGGAVINTYFEPCTSLTNWKNTSGTTYLPELVTQDGYTGVKAPQGQLNMSYHISYLDVPLRLDKFTVLQCDVYITTGQENKIGLVSTDNTYTGGHQYNSTGMLKNNALILENLNGNSANITTLLTGTWIRAYFIIDGQRGVTAITEDANNNIVQATVNINEYSSTDDTKNNRVYFGMHSAYRSYPLVVVRNILVHEYEPSN